MHTLEEVSGKKSQDILEKEKLAKKVYDNMLDKLKELNIEPKNLPPVNPFPTESQYLFDDVTEYVYEVYGQDLSGDGESATWYGCNKNMCKVSLHFKDTLIKIHGEGEENDDIWDAWYLNGKYVQKQYKLIAPTLNLSEMKEYKKEKRY